jgi:hypothetical protein
LVAAAPTLRVDVPCTGCGYDLRGLPPDGRCPECGAVIADSLAEAVATRPAVAGATVPPLDRWWRREMLAAVVASVAGAVAPTIAMIVAALARPGVSGRAWVIGAVATGWVLQWYAALKLTTPEPGVRQRRSHVVNAWLLRVSATVYLLIPLIYGLLPRIDPYRLSLGLLAAASWLVLPALAAYVLQVRSLFRRLGLPTAASNATWLGLLLATSVLSHPAFFSVDDDTTPVELLVSLSSYQIGQPLYLVRLVAGFNEWGRMFMPHAVVALLSIAVQARLLVRLLRTPAAAPAASQAVIARRSVASSVP